MHDSVHLTEYIRSIILIIMNRVVHFEIYASDTKRAKEFYTNVFGWKIEPWGPPEQEYWHITTGTDGAGIDGGLWKRRDASPVSGAGINAFSCTIAIENIDETLEKIKNAGGSIAIEKQQIPHVGWLAYCKDTEGNMFGIVQSESPEPSNNS